MVDFCGSGEGDGDLPKCGRLEEIIHPSGIIQGRSCGTGKESQVLGQCWLLKLCHADGAGTPSSSKLRSFTVRLPKNPPKKSYEIITIHQLHLHFCLSDSCLISVWPPKMRRKTPCTLALWRTEMVSQEICHHNSHLPWIKQLPHLWES